MARESALWQGISNPICSKNALIRRLSYLVQIRFPFGGLVISTTEGNGMTNHRKPKQLTGLISHRKRRLTTLIDA
ncbi:MAG: hypothetical protein AB8B85_04950 [Paracoccaceae bacterium]